MLQEIKGRYGLSIEARAIGIMARLDELVVEWGRAISLSGFSNAEERMERYFAEALLAAAWLPVKGLAVDVGSGGGSPALPMAILNPAVQWSLLEPKRRKAVFLEEAIHTLRLSNVKIVRSRLEHYRPESAVDVVTSRGVSLGKDSLRIMSGWLQSEGQVILFTGRRLSQEIARYQCGSSGLRLRESRELPTRAKPWLLIMGRQKQDCGEQ